jgi:hypothetical protein
VSTGPIEPEVTEIQIWPQNARCTALRAGFRTIEAFRRAYNDGVKSCSFGKPRNVARAACSAVKEKG